MPSDLKGFLRKSDSLTSKALISHGLRSKFARIRQRTIRQKRSNGPSYRLALEAVAAGLKLWKFRYPGNGCDDLLVTISAIPKVSKKVELITHKELTYSD